MRFTYNRHGCLVVVLVGAMVLAFVPVHGYRDVSGSPEILSNAEMGSSSSQPGSSPTASP